MTTMYDLALDEHADAVEAAMYRGDYEEDLFAEIESMLRCRGYPGGMDVIQDASLADIIARAARKRAMSAVDADTVSAIEIRMQEEARRGG